MGQRKEVNTLDDVKFLVDTFYGKVRQDEMLADIFNNVIQDKWPEHLEKLGRFWQTVLLEEHTYYGSPFLPHAQLPVEWQHFERSLKLFIESVDDNFIGQKAEQAKWQVIRLAQMFHSKIEFYKNNTSSPLL